MPVLRDHKRNGLTDSLVGRVAEDALSLIDEYDMREVISVPLDTFRMAAAQYLSRKWGASSPRDYNEEQKVAGTSELVWIREYLIETYCFFMFEDEYTHIDTEGCRIPTDDEELLRSDVEYNLREAIKRQIFRM